METEDKNRLLAHLAPPGYELVLAGDEDAELIGRMTGSYLRSLGLTVEHSGLDADLADPLKAYRQGGFILARRDGLTLGCCGLRLLEEGLGELKRMYVDPAGRGDGLGRALLEATIALAGALGLNRLVLDTRLDLKAANRLYESAGFRDIEDYNSNPRAGRFMALDLI